MSRAELLSWIDEAKRSSLADQRRLLRKIKPLLAEPWVDATMRSAVEELALGAGVTLEVKHDHAPRVGETWLLLVGAGGGDVVRLCAHDEGRDGGPGLQHQGSKALRGLFSAATRRGVLLPRSILLQRLTIEGGEAGLDLDGTSLGLAACVAAVARLLGRALATNVAGSAAVLPDGQLAAVEGMTAKVRALRERWPHVDTLVVADDQSVEAGPELEGLTLTRAAHLEQAFEAFGLELELGEPPTNEALAERLAEIQTEEVLHHSVEEWGRLSIEALGIGSLLRQRTGARWAPRGWDATLLSGLLASHAGDNERAADIIATVPDSGRSPLFLARKRVFQASVGMGGPEKALASAVEAVSLCGALPDEERAEWLGRALGTHGRVLLQAGRAAEAEPLLRAALEHHHGDPTEWPRSACYLVQCLRMLGHHEDSLAIATEAVTHAEAIAGSQQREAAILYARLELGRSLLELARFEEAIAALARVVAGQAVATAYPRFGAHRSLVRAYRGAERLGAAKEHLRICLDVAMGDSTHVTLRKVGAVAAAEELMRGGDETMLASREELERAWSVCFGGVAMETVRVNWIY